MRFRYLLIFLFFIFCMVPAVVITVYSYRYSVDLSHQSMIKDATIASSRAKRVIRYSLLEAYTSLSNFAENPAFTLLSPHDQSETLNRYLQKYPLFEDFYYGNSDDVIVASTDRTQIGYRLSDTRNRNSVALYPVVFSVPIESGLNERTSQLLASVDLGELKKRIYLAEQPGPRNDFLPFTLEFEVHKQIKIAVDSDLKINAQAENQLGLFTLDDQPWDNTTLLDNENEISRRTRVLTTRDAFWDMFLTIHANDSSDIYKSLLYRNLIVLAVTTMIALALIRVIGSLMTAPESILIGNLTKEREKWDPLPSYTSSAILRFSTLFEHLTEHLHTSDKRTLSLAARKLLFLQYIQSLCKPILEELKNAEADKRASLITSLDTLLLEITEYQAIESAGFEEHHSFFRFDTLVKKLQASTQERFPNASIEISSRISAKEYYGNSSYLHDTMSALIELLLMQKHDSSALELYLENAAPYLHNYHSSAICSIRYKDQQDDCTQITAYNEGLLLKDIPLDTNYSLAHALARIHLMDGSLYVEYDKDRLVGLHLTFEANAKQPVSKQSGQTRNNQHSSSPFLQVLSKFQHGSLPPLSLLLVDDNKTLLRIHREILEDMGHTVTTAEDGREALYAYGSTHFDAAIFDCDMPVIDGYDAATAIREIEDGQDDYLPILGLGNILSADEQERCRKAGIDDYMIKPTTREELVKRLQALLRPMD